ncbi:hypothetical protein E2C01_065396 [Portunus trituberculatus]|uniref:Uncharacterized protein n=1 Tax=Portunus trituberculatus TaxID=210409 RepID=A0A5B7HPG4_PORTR|nr:hypothetical protein [Portunus trituberculatus]
MCPSRPETCSQPIPSRFLPPDRILANDKPDSLCPYCRGRHLQSFPSFSMTLQCPFSATCRRSRQIRSGSCSLVVLVTRYLHAPTPPESHSGAASERKLTTCYYRDAPLSCGSHLCRVVVMDDKDEAAIVSDADTNFVPPLTNAARLHYRRLWKMKTASITAPDAACAPLAFLLGTGVCAASANTHRLRKI